MRPEKHCAAPLCGNKAQRRGYCRRHARTPRGTSKRLRWRKLYNREWERVSKAFLVHHPVCNNEHCSAPSAVTDHIKPHRGDRGVFWDASNWQALCKRCHDYKTATEIRGADGQFQ